jgi:hypothetical protein
MAAKDVLSVSNSSHEGSSPRGQSEIRRWLPGNAAPGKSDGARRSLWEPILERTKDSGPVIAFGRDRHGEGIDCARHP